MTTDHATEYADRIAAGIRANDEIGSPFGIVSDDNPATDRENGDDVSAMDYLSDALDIQYLVNADRSYRSARVLIAFGGPNAWIDTQTGQLEFSWWGAPVMRDLPNFGRWAHERGSVLARD